MLKCLCEKLHYLKFLPWCYLNFWPSLSLYLLRTLPYFISSNLTIYDDELRVTICISFNIYLAESERVWMQSTLPVHHGRLGIQSAGELALSAFLASAAASSNLACLILPANMQQPQFSYVDEVLVCLVPRVQGTTPHWCCCPSSEDMGFSQSIIYCTHSLKVQLQEVVSLWHLVRSLGLG